MKVHWIGSHGLTGWQFTACGMQAMKCDGIKDEYDTHDSRRIEARHLDWKGVTCKSCLRNPHAPGGRHAKAVRDVG